ncbi:hypothetical protein CEXT_672191 [Caerostris extrusa]|uniref:Uncharacterized protein n=1 Tax=Caerostris extrusa TaxID=172846 RepID=A0AAV4NGS9_CAEEX|nr:hypothetical protein CEXT_672191 [Caerostris extrusa]
MGLPLVSKKKSDFKQISFRPLQIHFTVTDRIRMFDFLLHSGWGQPPFSSLHFTTLCRRDYPHQPLLHHSQQRGHGAYGPFMGVK